MIKNYCAQRSELFLRRKISIPVPLQQGVRLIENLVKNREELRLNYTLVVQNQVFDQELLNLKLFQSDSL